MTPKDDTNNFLRAKLSGLLVRHSEGSALSVDVGVVVVRLGMESHCCLEDMEGSFRLPRLWIRSVVG